MSKYSEWGQRAPLQTPLVSTVTAMGVSILYTAFMLFGGLTVQMSQQHFCFLILNELLLFQMANWSR